MNKHEKRMFSEKNLTFQKSLEVANVMKTAPNDAIEIQAKHFSLPSGVNKLILDFCEMS
jgi:hypothetical protein